MKKKIMHILVVVGDEAIATIALWFTLAFIYLIADGDFEELFRLHNAGDYVFVALTLTSVRYTISDLIRRFKNLKK